MKNLLHLFFTAIVLCFTFSVAKSQNCTLPVNGGSLSASLTTVCPSNNFNITVSGSSTGTGLSYQWESSPDNTNWTPLNGQTSSTLFTTQFSTTWYRRQTFCDAGGNAYSNSIQIVSNHFSNCYCTPTTATCTTYSITNVSFGSLNNSSACGANAYTNYTSTVTAMNLAQGSYLPIAITVTNASPSRFVQCFIDYNQNGLFDPKEHTLIFPPAGNVYNGFIKVPFTAKLGLTRMRVIYNSGSTNSCFQEPFSEAEDYAINITANTTGATGHVIYIKTNPAGSNSSGMSWTNAVTSLRTALGIATPGDTIKMAAGTYYSGSSQTNGTIGFNGCPGNSLSFTATPVNGGGNPQYQWFVNNQLQATGNSFTLNNATNGMQVYVRMNSSASCASVAFVNSAVTTVNCVVTAIPPVEGLEKFSVSPNPSSGQIVVIMKLQRLKTVSFRITDANSKTVFESLPARVSGAYSRPIRLDVAAGIYYLRTMIGNQSFVEKIIIAR